MFYTWKTMAIAARLRRLSNRNLMLALGGLLMAALPAAAIAPPTTTTTLSLKAGGNVVTAIPSGTVVTLTATVMAGNTPVTLGTVKFCDAAAAYCEDIHILGSAQLTSAGTATLHISPGISTHSYQAIFVGTTSAASSVSSASSLLVSGYNGTSATLQSSGTAGNYTLTGRLTAFGVPAPTGHLLFENQSHNNEVAAMSALDPAALSSGFTPLQSYGTGANPYSIAAGDFKGNGILDFAVANRNDGTVSVLLGNGDGTFAGARNYAVGNSPSSIAVGDFNGDGIPDLVAANYGEDTVTVLLGIGDGTFAVQTAIAVGSLPAAVAVGDFNNDGILDIAVADSTSGAGAVSILLGNGNGTFQPAMTSPTGSIPAGIAIADFNGDGFLDVVTANSGSNNVSVLLGKGDGTFKAAASYALASGGSNPAGVTVADFNSDGSPDIAVAGTGNVSVVINKGTGVFSPAVGYAAGNGARSIVVGDFDLDGTAHLAVANANSSDLSILSGIGDGTFGSPSNSTVGGTPQAVTVGDFNGDGRPDLAAAVTGTSNYAGVFLGEQTVTAAATGVSILGAGTQNVAASYSSDSSYNASVSSPVALVGSGTATDLAVVATPNPAGYGVPLSVVATLTPSNATGIAAANFTAFLDGTILLAIVAKGGNQFQISGPALSALSLGSHSIVVNFSGALTYLASTGSATLQINQATPTLNWNPPPTVIYGAPITQVLSASAVNGTTAVVGSYAYTATPSGGAPSPITGTTLLLPGIYTISVTFTPTDTTDYQSVSGSTTLTVNQGKPTVSIASSLSPVFVGNSVTFTANVSSTAIAPSGSINFVDGQTLLGSVPLAQGAATYMTSSLAIGGHSITAVYSGDANYVTVASTPIAESVEDFTLTAAFPIGTISPPSVVPGGSLTVNILATPTLGATLPSSVMFSVSGLPTGATATLTPQTLAAGSNSDAATLSIHLANQIVSNAPPHPLPRGLVLAMAGGIFLLPFASRKVRRSGGGAGRFVGLMLLLMAATGGALGLTACGSGGGSGYFGQQQKNYTVTITATSGALTHSATVNFIVE